MSDPPTLNGLTQEKAEKGHDKGTGLAAMVKMDSELTSAIHTGADN
jgi:hypothetical protein